ncbi:hypothetical protein B0T18DRAFT_332000 [Schizothecium vesticola]|uniref:Uncharacterized protein n=1 Tax=Schizothecium vesticola TaxID=314040 RepID=A0AA40EJF6_9PEZI|nr:hypothetical protein B0T18DRAFT_332000 [Schizothecium vesticola]
MDYSSPPGSPDGDGSTTPLQPLSHNQQRDSLFPSMRRTNQQNLVDSLDARDSTVHDKVNQFNSLTMQSKALERKTADAALKRAMMGREEAEAEMRRYRDEAKQLRKQIDDAKERERKVGERLETVMENYGRAKETHAHTQTLWEKEIRRARKETFKAQSALVKLQEELKSSRAGQKSAEEGLEREKERSQTREQEAFAARYSLVGLQEQLDQSLERIKMLEQERDAFKALAKDGEDLARMAAESKSPLPSRDESATPNKKRPREPSANLDDTKISANSEHEIEELTRLWQWEKQRADRAVDHVQFLEIECHLKCCSAGKAARRSRASFGRVSFGTSASPRRKRSVMNIIDAGDLVILSEKARSSSSSSSSSSDPDTRPPSPKRSKTEMLREGGMGREGRQSTIFLPTEGIFRTVSQVEAEALSRTVQQTTTTVIERSTSNLKSSEPPTPADAMPAPFARTPSVDPPDFAIPAQLPRTSLLSLLDAPHQLGPPLRFNIPTTPAPGPVATQQTSVTESEPSSRLSEADTTAVRHPVQDVENATSYDKGPMSAPLPSTSTSSLPSGSNAGLASAPYIRPHTSAATYGVATVTKTTKIPLREETTDPSLASRIMKQQRTPSRSASRADDDGPSFDINNPALTPTMTREQALAQIRERRVRAQSVGKMAPMVPEAQQQRPASRAAVTPRRPADKDRRDVSAPTARTGGLGVTPSARRVRS